jgi:hypothetical protein
MPDDVDRTLMGSDNYDTLRQLAEKVIADGRHKRATNLGAGDEQKALADPEGYQSSAERLARGLLQLHDGLLTFMRHMEELTEDDRVRE